MGERRFLDYRKESQAEWGVTFTGKGSDGAALNDDQLRLGALLRIADALERAYPKKKSGDEELWEVERASMVAAYEVYLTSKGLGESMFLGDDEWGLSEATYDALDTADIDGRDLTHLPDLLCVWASSLAADYGGPLTNDQLAELRAALAARGLYLASDWPDE